MATNAAHVVALAESQTKAASEGATVSYRHPPIDEAKKLNGQSLLTALRRGGYVLYLRHTEAGTVTETCGQSNLSIRGERDARFVGDSIRQLRIPIDQLATSPVCRVRDTARLLGLGEPEVTADLANVAMPPGFDFHDARGRRITARPKPGNNTLLVSHLQSGHHESQWIQLDLGEIIVFSPNGKGASEPVARIRADDWYALMSIAQK